MRPRYLFWARYRDVGLVALGFGLLAGLVWADARWVRAILGLAFLGVGWLWR